MSLQTAGDIPLKISSENSGPNSERRITPSWTIGQLKSKLEPVTGIPPGSQKLTLKLGSRQSIPIQAVDEETTQIGLFPLAPYAELHVEDIRPPGQRPNYNDVNQIAKVELSPEEYAKKTDSVLAWKKANKLGRFDPSAPSAEEVEKTRLQAYETEISTKGIVAGKRCRVGKDDSRRGEVMFVGEVKEIPSGGKWVGVKLDEPAGKNDGSIGGTRYWGVDVDGGGPKYGVFVRPERIEIGDWPALDDLDEEMDEI